MKTAHILLLAAVAGVAFLLFQSGNLPGFSNPVDTDTRPGGSDPGKGKGGVSIMPISTDFSTPTIDGGDGQMIARSGAPRRVSSTGTRNRATLRR